MSILGMSLYKLLRKCLVPFLPAFLVSGIFIVSYGIMTGNGVSTIRAITMFCVAVFAAVIGRSYDGASAMALSAAALILAYPKVIYNTGFWLSFLAVAGIMVIKPVLLIGVGYEQPKHGDSRRVKVLKYFLDGFITSLSANIATVPVLLFSYYELPTYSIILNMIILPLMTLLMISVAAGGFLGLLWLPTGAFGIGMAHYILAFYEWVCNVFMELPFAVVVYGKPAFWQIFMYYIIVAAMVYVIYYVYVREKKIIKPKNAMIVGIAASFLVLVVRFPAKGSVNFIDVGQGDGIHISSRGVNMLVDGGSSSVAAVGEYRIIPYLKSEAVSRIDYMVVSHGDVDHISGLLEILQNPRFTVGYLVLPDVSDNGKGYSALCDAAEKAGTEIKFISSGDWFGCGDFKVTCLHPASGYAYESTNDYSTVLLVEMGELEILLTGDVEDFGENHMLYSGVLQDADILKVAHHGSRYSTDMDFLNCVKPEVAIISCAEGNLYGHPHKETLDRLKAVGSRILTTPDGGMITVRVDGTKVMIEEFLGE